MLIRQFSLRLLLVVVTACAGISLLFSLAFQQRAWAVALMALLVALAAMTLVQASAFGLVWLLSRIDLPLAGRMRKRVEPGATVVGEP